MNEVQAVYLSLLNKALGEQEVLLKERATLQAQLSDINKKLRRNRRDVEKYRKGV